MSTHALRSLALLALGLGAVSAAHAAPYSGAYVGVGLGYAAGHDDGLEIPSDPTYAFSTKTDSDGGLFSIAAGYDLLLTARWVLGFGAEAQIRDLNTFTYQRLNGVPSNVDSDRSYEDPIKFTSNFATTLGPRLGYLFNDGATLFYTSTGLSIARVSRSFGCTGACSFAPDQVTSITQTDWQTGWALGLGVEHRIGAHASLLVDYHHADFGTELVDTSPMYPGARERQAYSEDVLRFGINYRF